MAKLTTDPVGNFNSEGLATLNANFDKVEAALENTVSRDGSVPNQMEADLDMNHNDIINVDNIHAANGVFDDIVVKNVDLNGIVDEVTGLRDQTEILRDQAAAHEVAAETAEANAESAAERAEENVAHILAPSVIAPTTRDNGDPLETGDYYFDTTEQTGMVWTGSQWTFAGLSDVQVIDEDDMASDSATKVPTQQSVKAYVDANAGDVTVANKAALAALSATDGERALITGSGAANDDFLFDGSDLSTEVTNDPGEGIYVPPTSDTTGASGAWVRAPWVRSFKGPIHTKWFDIAADGNISDNTGTDDAAAIQYALDEALVYRCGVIHEGLSVIDSALRVDRVPFIGATSNSGIVIRGDHDGIILTGVGDGSDGATWANPKVRNLEIWADGTQGNSRSGILLGDGVAGDVLAHFLTDDIRFKVIGNGSATGASAIRCADDTSTGFAYIGTIRNIDVHKWRHPFIGTYAVNNILFDGWSQSRCTQAFRIGDVRGVIIQRFESGSNDFRAMDIGDCQGLTIIEPYLENNFRDSALPGTKSDILINAQTGAGFRRTHADNSIRILGGTFNKPAGGAGNCEQAISWVYSKGVVIDGASIGGYTNSIVVSNDANNAGKILNLQLNPTVHAAAPSPTIGASANVLVEEAGKHTIVKRGQSSGDAAGVTAVAFSKAFPNAIESVVVTPISSGDRRASVSGISTSGFTCSIFDGSGAAATNGFYWEAVGN